jgi:hypothetical protein
MRLARSRRGVGAPGATPSAMAVTLEADSVSEAQLRAKNAELNTPQHCHPCALLTEQLDERTRTPHCNRWLRTCDDARRWLSRPQSYNRYMRLPVLLLALASVQAFAQATPAIVIQASTVLDGKGGVLRNQQIVIEGATI